MICGFISVALLVTVVGFISVNASRKILQKNIGENYVALAIEMLRHIDGSIYARVETFQEYCRDLVTQRVISESNKEFEKLENIQAYIDKQDRQWTSLPKEEVTAYMQSLMNNELSRELREKADFYEEKYGYRVFGEIFVTNKYGANVAETGKTSDYYQADEQWWQEAKKNGLYVADVEYDRSAEVYATDVCIRIDDHAGNFSGVIKVVLNIEETINIIKKAEAAQQQKQKTTEFKLLTKDGKVIYSTEEYEFLENLPKDVFSRLCKEEEHKHRHYFIAAGDKRDEEEELFAHVYSKGHRDYKGIGWILVVEHKTKEVFAPIAALRNHILTVSLAITALAVTIGLVISKSIANPVAKLTVAAAKIGKCSLDTRVEVSSNDEIGQLADSFNKMAEDLETTTTSIDNLNQEIIERKKAEEALRSLNRDLRRITEKLEEANRELKDFVYIASHDLREPLRKISSFGGLLKDSLQNKLEEDDKENLDFMVDGANRMTEMTEGLLMYSRLNTKNTPFETVDLSEIVERLRQVDLAMLLQDTGCTIEVPQPLPKVQANPVQVSQLLQNFVANGIKFRRKGIKPQIVITADRPDNNTVRIQVCDKGIGIDEKYHNDIFTMFRRLHSSQEYEGTGIGLALCKKIVDRHGGRIGVESRPGQGSTFWFTLSAAEEYVPVA